MFTDFELFSPLSYVGGICREWNPNFDISMGSESFSSGNAFSSHYCFSSACYKLHHTLLMVLSDL